MLKIERFFNTFRKQVNPLASKSVCHKEAQKAQKSAEALLSFCAAFMAKL